MENAQASSERLPENGAGAAAAMRWRHRAVWSLPALGSTALLGVAASLTPDGSGFGTHTQLPGMTACTTLAATGIPCPTCGMTTAFAHAAAGDLFASFATQPAGAVLAVLTAVVLLVSFYGLYAGMPPQPLWRRIWSPRLLIVGGVMIVAGWIYKILNVQGVI